MAKVSAKGPGGSFVTDNHSLQMSSQTSKSLTKKRKKEDQPSNRRRQSDICETDFDIEEDDDLDNVEDPTVRQTEVDIKSTEIIDEVVMSPLPALSPLKRNCDEGPYMTNKI